ncbi:hypothetical protein C6Q07_14065, partial [Burkholderia multivorans]
MRAALAPIPAEPWDALTAERRIADRAPTPAGAARREPPRGACATMHASRAPVQRHLASAHPHSRPTHRRPTKSGSISPPPPPPPPQP